MLATQLHGLNCTNEISGAATENSSTGSVEAPEMGFVFWRKSESNSELL